MNLISLTADELFEQLTAATATLLYPSETDAPFSVHRFGAEYVGERYSQDDLMRDFYHDQPSDEPLDIQWAMMERFDSEGYKNFFRHFADYITQEPGSGNFQVWEPAHRQRADLFQKVRDLFMNHMVHQRWFRVNLPDGVNKAIYIAGQLLTIEFDENTNEIKTTPSEWFVLQTGTVET